MFSRDEERALMKTALKLSLLVAALIGVAAHVEREPPAAGQQPNRPAQSYPVPASGDESGFEPIFDGKTLQGWEGDPQYWRVENGCLVGEVTPKTILKQNSFIIWRGGTTRDFELKVEYRVSAQGNSGINYRSVEVPGQPWGDERVIRPILKRRIAGPARFTRNAVGLSWPCAVRSHMRRRAASVKSSRHWGIPTSCRRG